MGFGNAIKTRAPRMDVQRSWRVAASVFLTNPRYRNVIRALEIRQVAIEPCSESTPDPSINRLGGESHMAIDVDHLDADSVAAGEGQFAFVDKQAQVLISIDPGRRRSHGLGYFVARSLRGADVPMVDELIDAVVI